MTPAGKRYGTRLQVELPPELFEKVDALSEAWLTSRAAVIRRIISDYFKEKIVTEDKNRRMD